MLPLPCAFCGTATKEGSTGERTARLLVDSLRAGTLAVGPDGHVCDANPGAANILRRSVEELCRSRIDDVLAPLDRLRAASSNGDRLELALRLTDGTSAVLGCSVTAIESDGARGWVVLFQEISALAELRRRHDRLLQLAALGEVLPSVLHEIRNPLASATSMLEILVEEADGRQQADLHALLGEIRRINLCLQGIGGLHTDLTSSSFDAVDVAIREACRILRSTAETRGVRIQVAVPDLPLLPIRAAAVRGVVFNLVRNAIDACGNDGDIRVEARLDAARRRLVLSVKDSGCGMTEAQIERCCELFYTTKEHGSGVGLPICKQAVERAGGDLRVKSKPREGTEVVIEVPIAARAQG